MTGVFATMGELAREGREIKNTLGRLAERLGYRGVHPKDLEQ